MARSSYKLFDNLAKGRSSLNIFLRIPHPWTAEMISHQDFDSITLDLQHSLIGRETMALMLAALRKEVYPMARLSWNDPAQIMYALDVGVKGVICPMINSRQDAEAFVSACFYPPKGIRSYGSIRSNLPPRETYMKDYDEDILTIAQIETRAGLENIEAIASTPHLSGLYLGPYDLSIDLGYTKLADFSNPDFMKQVERVLSVAKKHKLLTCVHAFGEEDAVRLSTMGFDIITPMDETSMMMQAIREKLGRVKSKIR